MPYREQRIYSGALLEIERKHCTHCGRVIGAGKSRLGTTSDAQKVINRKNAQRKLVRLMCTNFDKGDLHITLTDDEGMDKAQHKACWARFIRRLRSFCQKQTGQGLRYIAVCEWQEVRTHWHVVCKKLPILPSQLEKMWGKGRVELGTLDGNPDYGWFARYLTKQPERENWEKAWQQSKNLQKPIVSEPKILKRRQLASRPALPKGYYLLASYRYATSWGYEGEYLVAIRQDRKKVLPPVLQQEMERSGIWQQLAQTGIQSDRGEEFEHTQI